MRISPKLVLDDAREKGYAVPAFNYYNLDVLFAALEAAEEEKAPVICQPYSAYFPFLHYEVIADASRTAIDQAKTCGYLHLDHATDFDLIIRAIRAGFDSVMVDGSALPLEENIALSKSVADAAKAAGVYTEAEIGRIFRAGVDDGLDTGDETARVGDCVRLVEETGVDSLAPAVGTAHGVYTKPPKIHFERIRELRQAVNVPLVLHGGSGTPEGLIRKAIACGVSKINVGTELKHMWSKATKEMLDKGEKEPRMIAAYAREKVKEVARGKLRLFGASGRAAAIISKSGRQLLGDCGATGCDWSNPEDHRLEKHEFVGE